MSEHTYSTVDVIALVKERILRREQAIEALQPQIARSEQFANELRGKLFTAQAQHAELSDLLSALVAKATPEELEARDTSRM